MRRAIPAIRWGAAFANVCEIAYPLVGVTTHATQSEGSDRTLTRAYGAEGWSLGEAPRVSATLLYVPPVDEASVGMNYGVTVTGWEGATGWRALLAYGHTQRGLRLYPDRTLGAFWTVKLIEPWNGADIAPDPGNYGRRFPVTFQAADGMTRFDGY